jgi:uncharacterized membrane protein
VKAISPGINDPVTAGHAVGYCADLLTRLQGRHLGWQQHTDDAGTPWLVTPDRDRRYLDLACAPVRRFGTAEPLLLTALLRLLGTAPWPPEATPSASASPSRCH